MQRLFRVVLIAVFTIACSHAHVPVRTEEVLVPIPAGDANLLGLCQTRDRSVLPGVTVVIRDAQGHGEKAVTDAAGHYQFMNLQPGTYTIRWELEYYGYLTRTITLRPGKTGEIVATIRPAKELATVVIVDALLLDVNS